MKCRLVHLSALAAGVLLLAWPGSAPAQDRTGALEETLAMLPAGLLAPETGATITFADIGAARVAVNRNAGDLLAALTGGDGPLPPFRRIGLLPGDWQASILEGIDGGWEPLIGFGPDDVEILFNYALPPQQLTFHRLSDAVDPADVESALLANGYVPRDHGSWTLLGRGEDDLAIDMESRNPADPFGGMLGRASRVALSGPYLAQGPAWPLVEAVAGEPAGNMAAMPQTQALIAALDDDRFGEARLVQLALATSQWPADDPIAAANQGQEDADIGLPAWMLAAFADLSTGATDYGVIAMVFADAAAAETAAASLDRFWSAARASDDPPAAVEWAGGPAELIVTDGRLPAVMLVVERDMASEETLENRIYRGFIQGYMNRELGFMGLR